MYSIYLLGEMSMLQACPLYRQQYDPTKRIQIAQTHYIHCITTLSLVLTRNQIPSRSLYKSTLSNTLIQVMFFSPKTIEMRRETEKKKKPWPWG